MVLQLREQEGTGAVASLRANALSEIEAMALSVAQIGPAIEVIFVVGAIGAVVGVGAPLIVLVAGLGYLLHANTTAEFSNSVVSAGGYTAYMEAAFTRRAGRYAGVLFVLGFSGIAAGFLLLVALWSQTAVMGIFSVMLPWPFYFVVLSVGLGLIMLRGVVVSSLVAISLFAFELAVVLSGLGVMLVNSASHLTLSAFSFASVHGSAGIAIAFPLAIFMFVGASNPAPMSEEIGNPRHSVAQAVLVAVVFATGLFVVASVAIDASYKNSATLLGKVAFPFISAPGVKGSPLVDLIYIAGFTSVCAIFLAGFNAGARVIFSLARRGMLPPVLAHTNRWQVPGVAIGVAVVIWGVGGLIAGSVLGLVGGFSDIAGVGSDVYVILLISVNVALLRFFLAKKASVQRRSNAWGVTRNIIFPLAGSVVLGYPLWESIKPGAVGFAGWDWVVCVACFAAGCLAWLWPGTGTIRNPVRVEEE